MYICLPITKQYLKINSMKKLITLLIITCATTFNSISMAQNKQAAATKPEELNMTTFTQKVGTFDKNSDEIEITSKKPVVIDFYATWCGPCKKMAPSIDMIAAQMTDIAVYKVDVDKNPALAQKFNIRSLPTIVYIPLEGAMSITTGYMDHQALVSSINKFIFKK